jgi:chorismate mutase
MVSFGMHACREGLMAFISKPEVEAKNVQRVILKARTFAQNILAGEDGQLAPLQSRNTTYKIHPEYLGTVFRDYVMPLTTDVEVDGLLARRCCCCC